jgi:hypothetical protein
MDSNNVGYVFGIDCFVFGICSFIYNFTCVNFPRKIIFVMGLSLAGITFLMMGPSYYLDFPNSNTLTVSSFFLLGLV